jgi:predicted dehydrogenase
MKLGAIGIDSSHLPVFSERIKELNDAGETPCRVTHFWSDGQHDWPNADDVENWKQTTLGLGAKEAATLDELLDSVDGVLVLAVSGGRHLELARPALERGLPTYIDKPLACTLGDAREIRRLAVAHDARCYSASSLRFAAEVHAARQLAGDEGIGDIVAIDAFGPGELNDGAPGLLHYGVHAIEMVDAIWGGGVSRVSAIATEHRHLLDMDYTDGRLARLRLDRAAAYEFGATVHGTKGVHQFRVDFAPVYGNLVRGMTRFFEGGDAPATLEAIVENVAVMVAGNRSADLDGAWQMIDQ